MNLEFEKKKLELKKVETAKLEMEYKVFERLHDIERIKSNIKVQEETIEKIKEELKGFEG